MKTLIILIIVLLLVIFVLCLFFFAETLFFILDETFERYLFICYYSIGTSNAIKIAKKKQYIKQKIPP